jgi:hypothetical protein
MVPLDATLEEVLEESAYTQGELPSHPLTAPYAAQFDAFQQDWFGTSAARVVLVITVHKAAGLVAGVDAELDDFVDLFDRTLLIAVKNDREALLYRYYFGNKSAYLLKRPVLSDELETVRGWISSIQSSPIKALSALAGPLTTLVARADAAAAALKAAEGALAVFDTLGPKKDLIGRFNALRQKVWGEIAAMPHENPDLMLPSDFADRFFRHFSRTGVGAMTNPKDVEKRIATLQRWLKIAEDHLQALLDKAAERAKQQADADAARALLEQRKKEEEEAKQRTKAAKKAYQSAKKK